MHMNPLGGLGHVQRPVGKEKEGLTAVRVLPEGTQRDLQRILGPVRCDQAGAGVLRHVGFQERFQAVLEGTENFAGVAQVHQHLHQHVNSQQFSTHNTLLLNLHDFPRVLQGDERRHYNSPQYVWWLLLLPQINPPINF